MPYRYGCCLNMVARESDGTGAENSESCAQAGFNYLELSLSHLMALSPERRKTILSLVNSSGLPCEACNNFIPAGFSIFGDQSSRNRLMEYAIQSLELAAEIGASVVVFGSAIARMAPEWVPPQEIKEHLEQFVAGLLPTLDMLGVDLAVEHLNRGECNTLTSFNDALAFASSFRTHRVGVLLDTYHFELERENPADIVIGAGLIKHVHIARLSGRRWPTVISPDLRSILGALHATGYSRTISIEGYTTKLQDDANASFRCMKEQFEQNYMHSKKK